LNFSIDYYLGCASDSVGRSLVAATKKISPDIRPLAGGTKSSSANRLDFYKINFRLSIWWY